MMDIGSLVMMWSCLIICNVWCATEKNYGMAVAWGVLAVAWFVTGLLVGG